MKRLSTFRKSDKKDDAAVAPAVGTVHGAVSHSSQDAPSRQATTTSVLSEDAVPETDPSSVRCPLTDVLFRAWDAQ